MTRETAEGLGLDRVAGALVARVSTKGPAADAGIEPGDVITKVDGFEVADARTALYRLTTRGVGNTAKVDVLRKGQPVTLDLALLSPPAPGKDDVRNLSGEHPFDGARVSNILPSLADEMGLDQNGGVVILSVRANSVAARLGFQPGDVITSLQEAKIANVAGLDDALDGKRQRLWVVEVVRAGKTLQLRVPG